MTRHGRPRTGFTLIEIAAAMVILAVGIGGLLAFRAEHLRAQFRAQATDRAATLAAELAARFRAGLAQQGSGAFESDPDYAWAILAGDPVEPFENVKLFAYTVSVIPRDDPEDAVVLTVWLKAPPKTIAP